jgi:hypothetical protein
MSMGTHRTIVGVLHLALGLCALIPVMVVTAVFGGIWGAVAFATHGLEHAHKVDAILGVSLFAILLIVFVTTAIAGAFGIAAGAGVLLGYRWGDVLATIAAALHVFNVPVGTLLALYTFWALWMGDRPARAQLDPRPTGLASIA